MKFKFISAAILATSMLLANVAHATLITTFTYTGYNDTVATWSIANTPLDVVNPGRGTFTIEGVDVTTVSTTPVTTLWTDVDITFKNMNSGGGFSISHTQIFNGNERNFFRDVRSFEERYEGQHLFVKDRDERGCNNLTCPRFQNTAEISLFGLTKPWSDVGTLTTVSYTHLTLPTN